MPSTLQTRVDDVAKERGAVGGRRDTICVMNRGRAEAEGTAAKRRDCQVTEE